MGMLYSRKDKHIETIGYPFLLKLQPGKTNIYIYFKHFNLALRATAFLLTKKQLINSNIKTESNIWFWKGFFLFATLIALILFFSTKNRMFGYYFIMNFGIGLLFSGEIGEITRYLTSVPFNLTANFKQTGVLISFIALPLLLNEISPFAKLRPKLWKLMFYGTAILSISWLGCLIPYFLTNKFLLFTTYLCNFYGPIFLLLQMYFLYVALRHKLKNAKYRFIGYGVYILALFIYIILPNLGLLKHGIGIYNTFIFGSLFEILMFIFIISKETVSTFEQRNLLLKKQKDHQSEIIKAIVESQERERNKVGRELHDMIGANISVIKQQADKKNTLLLNTIQRTIDSVRNLSHNLVTPLIKGDEFVDEINDLCVLFSDIDIKIKSIFFNWTKIENTAVATHLYRIVQELLQNAVKHSAAKEVFIQFIINSDGNLTLMYEDDGNGFDYKVALANNGLGLMNIDNRIKLIYGTIFYDTMKNRKGTTIIITVPLLLS